MRMLPCFVGLLLVSAFAGCATQEYLVVDLADDSVTTVFESDVRRFNADVYKTEKLVLRRIPAGSFLMGSPADEPGRESLPWLNRETRHKVTLTKDFYLGVFPVTQAQYAKVMGGANPSFFKENADAATCPVETVSYKMIRGEADGCAVPVSDAVDAGSFLAVLRARTGVLFDLPTEAQWEYACRAGTDGAVYFGVTTSVSYAANAWCKANSADRTHGVGQKAANPWGLYDMLGNVWEICRDRVTAAPNDDWGTADAVDPIRNVSGGKTIARGGAWLVDVANARAASRVGASDVSRAFKTYGFRLYAPAESDKAMRKRSPHFRRVN